MIATLARAQPAATPFRRARSAVRFDTRYLPRSRTDVAMADPYLIKKYSSRRLYDVKNGEFLTLADVDRLIRRGERIRVTGAKGKDETRSVLLQLLAEREAGGEPLLSEDVLHDMVRLYGNVMHGAFGQYMEDGLAILRRQQEAWKDQLPDAFKQATHGVMQTLLEQQSKWWQATQDAWLGGTTPSDRTPKEPAGATRKKRS